LGDTSDSNFLPGNVLIIQENDIGCGIGGICDQPDDEGSRPTGYLSFVFSQAVEILSLDFFDIEFEENGAEGVIQFFDELNAPIAQDTYFTSNTGDNTWSRLSFAGITGVHRLVVNLHSSGAVDNLVYNVVPAPAAFWVFGAALIGFIGFSRRTTV
jgi:hypothetical protein